MKFIIKSFITLFFIAFFSILSNVYALNNALFPFTTTTKAFVNTIDANANSTEVNVNAFFQGNDVLLIWNIPKGAKLYRDRIRIELVDAKGLHLGVVHFPKAKIWQDPILGPQAVYINQLSLKIPLYAKNSQIPTRAKLQVLYQACFEEKCLPFQQQLFTIQTKSAHPLTELPKEATNSVTSIKALPKETTPSAKTMEHYTLTSLLSLLGFGLLLSFTPCVLPMLPIISGVVLGQGDTNKLKGFLLSVIYVLGMALTYTVLGIAIALVGASFQSLFQMPIVLVITSLLFLLLALSMFDLFHISLPQKAQSFIHSLQEKPKSGSMLSAFVFGIIASLIVSPCTSAPLISILSLIAQSGDWIFGGLSLFVLAIGMGIPLILIGTGLGYFVPKTGAWMNDLKYLIGVFMLLMAIWLLGRVIPGHITLILYAVILVGYAVFLGAFEASEYRFDKIKRACGLILFIYGVSLFIGAMMGNTSLFKPLSFNEIQSNHQIKPQVAQSEIITITTKEQLLQALKKSKDENKQVILDFYARWCAECQLVSQLLQSEKAQQLLINNNTVLIKVDASNYSNEMNQILKDYQVIGFPTLIRLNVEQNEASRHSGVLSIAQLKQLII
ncbi:protein-disulfide reductase DsbD [Thiotrichales bacterium 19S3-7]|nr:protein-disulfide reductase DsbD [Thiotrichales bacterium 19S3-7]MCF6800814.1 protein-disulfide reductase DsbD [Thiotrichales bacterium 19S3-11]